MRPGRPGGRFWGHAALERELSLGKGQQSGVELSLSVVGRQWGAPGETFGGALFVDELVGRGPGRSR